MKQLTALFSLVVGVLILSSCSSTAHIEKDPSVNFNHFKSYAWLDDQEDNEDRYLKGLTKQNLRTAVANELSEISWREDKKRPDVIIKHDVLVERKVKESRDPVYSQPFVRRFYNPYTRRIGAIYYPSEFVGYDRRNFEVKGGTLTITMIDARTDKVIWQGWVTDELRSQQPTSKEIQESVRTIFKKFDPKS
jgi:Domain of unknown function (DUF4136)